MKLSASPTRTQRLDSVALTLLLVVYVVVMMCQFSHVQQTEIEINRLSKHGVVPPQRHQRVRAVDELDADLVVAVPTPAPSPGTMTVINGRKTLVFIVNFRDSKRCGETLQSMFENAVQPELLKVSVHDQISEADGELECVEAYCQLVAERQCRRNQIVSTKVDATEAKGPTVARYITEKAIGDEDFCLGLDSHLVFVPQWDVKLVDHWQAAENDNAILTAYPKSLEHLTSDHSMDDKMGLMCRAHIETGGDDAMVQYLTVKWLDRTNDTTPLLMSQFAGGFNFGTCTKKCPMIPVDIVYHWYEARTKIWDTDWSKRYEILMKSRRRTRYMMGLPVSKDDFDHTDLDKYGLGTKRTFQQWLAFSGIDPLAAYDGHVIEQFDNCRDLEFVPFEV